MSTLVGPKCVCGASARTWTVLGEIVKGYIMRVLALDEVVGATTVFRGWVQWWSLREGSYCVSVTERTYKTAYSARMAMRDAVLRFEATGKTWDKERE